MSNPSGAQARLFLPLKLRDVTFPNRIAVSPMCQYSAEDGFANDWHLVHLGSRVIGGAGTVIVEATAVEARGRITLGDLGIWSDQHIEFLARISRFSKQHGAVPAIQLAHAGRKASTEAPWLGGQPLSADSGAWQAVAPSAVAFDGYPVPAELSVPEIQKIVEAFAAAASRSRAAGFEVVEIHAAHGYLLHEFLSPLSNQRADQYGGSFENRIRLTIEVIDAVRGVWPEKLPLFLRISASDWTDNGWTADDSVALAKVAREHGVDLIDCSSGGNTPAARIPVGPGYQVPFAEQIRREAGIPTGAVGMITDPQQAEAILTAGAADLIVVAREFLREPYWAIKAAEALGTPPHIPVQYQRAFSSRR
jgi:2,4-dienoyl-CoA reductase-like NADH-dependent reductase (Old Yellow Enzyme family)